MYKDIGEKMVHLPRQNMEMDKRTILPWLLVGFLLHRDVIFLMILCNTPFFYGCFCLFCCFYFDLVCYIIQYRNNSFLCLVDCTLHISIITNKKHDTMIIRNKGRSHFTFQNGLFY